MVDHEADCGREGQDENEAERLVVSSGHGWKTLIGRGAKRLYIGAGQSYSLALSHAPYETRPAQDLTRFPMTQSSVSRAGLLLLAVFSFTLFVVPAVKDRGLTIHEAVLPQTSRSMYYDGDLVIPKRGTAPWLENPPLPQWVTVGLCHVFGTCDEVWVSRVGTALTGTALVVTVVFIAATFYGPGFGLMAGFVMATTYQVIRYSSLAEDEIYLALMVALAILAFVRLEFAGPQPKPFRPVDLVGKRPFGYVVLFLLLGMTNLTKGVVFGPVMALIPIAVFLILTLDVHRITRYFWLWGVVIFLVVGSAWPALTVARHPGALELWGFDLFGRLSGDYEVINQPVWYYLRALPEATAPWILLAPLGFWLTRQRAIREATSPERFLWVWAIAFPLVLTIPSGKHSHYLLHGLVPWVILATIALDAIWNRIARPGWQPRVAGVALFGFFGCLFAWGQWQHRGTHHFDAVMMRAVKDEVPAEAQMLADMDVIGLRQFHILMYLPADTIPVHNLTFLRDDRIKGDTAYIVTRYRKRDQFAPYADYRVLLQSERTDSSSEPDALLTLFELKFKPGVERVDTSGIYISPMQAMHRTPGPYLPPQ